MSLNNILVLLNTYSLYSFLYAQPYPSANDIIIIIRPHNLFIYNEIYVIYVIGYFGNGLVLSPNKYSCLSLL